MFLKRRKERGGIWVNKILNFLRKPRKFTCKYWRTMNTGARTLLKSRKQGLDFRFKTQMTMKTMTSSSYHYHHHHHFITGILNVLMVVVIKKREIHLGFLKYFCHCEFSVNSLLHPIFKIFIIHFASAKAQHVRKCLHIIWWTYNKLKLIYLYCI